MQCADIVIEEDVATFFKSIKKASIERARLSEEIKRTVKYHRGNGKLLSDINEENR
jgi:hypothetical protein